MKIVKDSNSIYPQNRFFLLSPELLASRVKFNVAEIRILHKLERKCLLDLFYLGNLGNSF